MRATKLSRDEERLKNIAPCILCPLDDKEQLQTVAQTFASFVWSPSSPAGTSWPTVPGQPPPGMRRRWWLPPAGSWRRPQTPWRSCGSCAWVEEPRGSWEWASEWGDRDGEWLLVLFICLFTIIFRGAVVASIGYIVVMDTDVSILV